MGCPVLSLCKKAAAQERESLVRVVLLRDIPALEHPAADER